MTDFSRPADGRVDNETPDILGFISLGLGVVSTMGCLGTCLPYVGFLFMMLSWMTTAMGVITGAAGIVVRKQADLSPTFSGFGLAFNLVILLLWVVYWVVMLGLFAVLIGFVVAAETM